MKASQTKGTKHGVRGTERTETHPERGLGIAMTTRNNPPHTHTHTISLMRLFGWAFSLLPFLAIQSPKAGNPTCHEPSTALKEASGSHQGRPRLSELVKGIRTRLPLVCARAFRQAGMRGGEVEGL